MPMVIISYLKILFPLRIVKIPLNAAFSRYYLRNSKRLLVQFRMLHFNYTMFQIVMLEIFFRFLPSLKRNSTIDINNLPISIRHISRNTDIFTLRISRGA